MAINNIFIRHLSSEDLTEMYKAFKIAFHDYPVTFKLSKSHFKRKFLDKLNINFKLSAGAFDNGTLQGFIFTSINDYENLVTAYNGGTGVSPAYRGNGITERIYNYLIPRFKQSGVSQCVLEVLSENKAAIRVYENIGFIKSRNFRCYKFNPGAPVSAKENNEIRIIQVESPDWITYSGFLDYVPCYIDSPAMISRNLSNEMVMEAKLNGATAGYAIFQPKIGRISQIAVDRNLRRKGIGSMLMRKIYQKCDNKALTIINVLEEANSIRKFLAMSGFENELDQYEMRLIL